jgi:hypothetical protein
MSYSKHVSALVLVNGRPVREYTHQGLTLIEARHGTNYTVKIKNDNSFKIMAVLSIDGLDVLTGKPAEDSRKGYIVDGESTTEIKGYRLNENESASFIFTKKDKSYVVQTKGDQRNTGVIGIRVFKEDKKPAPVVVEKVVEKIVHVPYYPYKPYIPYDPWKSDPWGAHPWQPIWYSSGTSSDGVSYSSNMMYATSADMSNTKGITGAATSNYNNSVASSAMRSVQPSNANFDTPQVTADVFDSGTSWGKKQSDRVEKEYFKVGKILTEIVFYYATKEALISMGVNLNEATRVADPLPSAFGETKYCKPPTNWRG